MDTNEGTSADSLYKYAYLLPFILTSITLILPLFGAPEYDWGSILALSILSLIPALFSLNYKLFMRTNLSLLALVLMLVGFVFWFWSGSMSQVEWGGFGQALIGGAFEITGFILFLVALVRNLFRAPTQDKFSA